MTALVAIQRLGESLFGQGELRIRRHGAWVASYRAEDVSMASGRGSSWESAVESLEATLVTMARQRGGLSALISEVERAWEAA